MTKYLRYILLVIVIIICIAILCNVFFRENKQLTEYKKKLSEDTRVIIPSIGEEITEQFEGAEPKIDTEKKDPIESENEVKVSREQTNVIVSSDSEILNKQGEELLKEISEELDKTIRTISSTPGIVDDNILNDGE